MRRYQNIFIATTLVTLFVLAGITLIHPMGVDGQTKERTALSLEGGRDPFLLPPGVHLLSKIGATPGRTNSQSGNIPSRSLMLTAILISDRAQLALIDRHIVTVGDSIHGEKVLEIKTDRVILGKGEQKKTLLLAQSPVQLTVEQTPPTNLPAKKGGQTLLEIPVDWTRNRAAHQTPSEGPSPPVEPFDPALRGADGLGFESYRPEYVEGQPDVNSDGVKEEVKGEDR